MEETIDSLSLPDQVLDTDYYHRVLNFTPKAVIAAPCGWGKTLGIACYIAEHYRDGVLYVAERTQQLHDMKQLLIDKHQVPEDEIGLYYANSADLKLLHQAELTKPIALMTHSRMQSHAPGKYTVFQQDGKLKNRQLLVVDEALPALIILSAPTFFVETWLRRMGLDWKDIGNLGPEEVDTRINRVQADIAKHSRFPFSKAGVDYLEWTNYLKESETSIGIRSFAYYLMLYQVLHQQYVYSDEGIRTLIPMAPHISWYNLFEQILVLDATSMICDYMYRDYTILQPGHWNFGDIELGLKYLSGLGNLSKTKTAKHRETLLSELEDHVLPIIKDQEFNDPYIVTYKTLNGDSFVNDVKSVFNVPVANYGNTRGSNEFREKDSVLLIGSYRPPVYFDTLAYKLFGNEYSPEKYAVSHWIQELYRTRIRNYSGEKINVLALGEREVIKAFESITSRFLNPISVSPHENPEFIEKILCDLSSQAQINLLNQLMKHREVNKKDFARRYTDRSVQKVERALKGLIKVKPNLEGHLMMDDDTIRLVDIPAPI